MSKDRDFRDGHPLRGTPARLLVVATGNISNNALMGLFTTYLDPIVAAFDESSFVELGPDSLVIHRDHQPSSEPEK